MNDPLSKFTLGRSSPLWRGLPELVILLGFALSALLYLQSQKNLEERQLAFFQSEVRKSVALFQVRMENYRQLLRSAAGLFAIQPDVSRGQFRHFLEHQGITAETTGIQGVGYAKRLSAAALQAHTQAVRREGFQRYAVHPPGPRPIYTSIVYLEPFFGRNLRAFGYDMYSEPVRREAMQRAVDTGAAALSGKVRLLQETGVNEQPGFLIYKPLYRGGHTPASLAERRAQLTGWVYAPFRMGDFMQGLLGEYAGDLLIDVYDGTEFTPDHLMHTEQSDSAGEEAMPPKFVAVHRISMMGHSWTLRLRPSPLTLSRLDSNLPSLLALAGVIVSLILGALTWVLVSARDRAIQTALAMNDELVQERARLTAILDGTKVGTWEWNVQTGQTVYNAEWAQMLGYTLEELQPMTIETWSRLTHPDDLSRARARLQQHFASEQDYYECELRMHHKLGHWVWVLDRGKVSSRNADGKPLMMYGTHQDITQRKEREQAYKHGAQHDALTGLPNRALLADRLERALLTAQRDGTRVALLFLDLDGFKQVNDTYGHDAGDVVLRTIARRIQNGIRATDTLARLGGDEFVVLLPDVGDPPNAIALAQKIAAAARLPISLSDTAQAGLSLSIGIALYPQHGGDAATLTEHADQAMYRAKRKGKNTVVLYDPAGGAPDTAPDSLKP